MDLQQHIRSLKRFQTVLPALLNGLSEEQLRWKPESGNWSILEIVCHLADEEVEDFRQRVKLTLESPGSDWPPIDPEGVAVSRKYNQQDFAETLQRFLDERAKSVEWLESLPENTDWNRSYEHPTGTLRAGDVLSGWVAHDHLHTRQIAKRLYEMTEQASRPYLTKYGGDL